MIKVLLIFILILGIIALFYGCSNDGFTQSLPAKKIDTSRYLGMWYEIARIPSWFEQDLVGVTATYSLNPDGHMKVCNSGFLKTLDGEKKTAIGDAWTPYSNETGHLKVSFFWPFAADYIVLSVDENYSMALVGSGKDYLWVLSRTPQLDEASYQSLLEKAKGLGFDVSKLEKVMQPQEPNKP